MDRTERAALGRFVMRAKEYLAIIRARDGALTLTTMLFAEDVRSSDDVNNAGAKEHKPTKKQLEAAVAVIEELSSDWDPEEYRDCYRERLQGIVKRKRKGETIKAPAAESEPESAPDLMEALERTLAELGDGNRKRQTQEA
jgi:DNA end-binding protein Ku